MEQISRQNIKWTHIVSPKEDDIEYVRRSCGIHPVVAKELMHSTLHPKVGIYDKYVYLVMRFPEYVNGEVIPRETDFIITKSELISCQYQSSGVLEEVYNQIKADQEEYFSKDAGYLLYQILQDISEKAIPLIDDISTKIDYIEKRIFLKENRNLLHKISLVRRDVNDFMSIVRPNNNVLEETAEEMANMFGKDILPYFNHLKSTYIRLSDLAGMHASTLQMLHDTNQAVVSDSLNKIIKILTMFSVIVFPLTLFAGIWGMNTQNMPLVGHAYDFWIVMILMAIATFSMLIFFKIKRWI